MGLGSLLGKLFGGGGQRQGEAVEYQGYTIVPAPMSQGGQFITAGVIRKDFPDGPREQNFVRADTHQSFDAACDHAVSKGRQIIDEQGERLFQSEAPGHS